MLELKINGRSVQVPPGCTIAAAVLIAGEKFFCKSVTGEPRAPLCGMGICLECRVTVDGRTHVRSCQTICAAGMEIRTDA